MIDPRDRPPVQFHPLLSALHEHNLDWVLSGSTVLAIYGADITPNDLDVVPALDPENLRRFALVLENLGAVPAHFPAGSGGLTLEQCLSWTPYPPTSANLDHLFVTTLGMLDIPPTLTGTYDALRPGATRLMVAGILIWICDPDEVLRHLPTRPRAKDQQRHATYTELRRRLRTDRTPHGLSRWDTPSH